MERAWIFHRSIIRRRSEGKTKEGNKGMAESKKRTLSSLLPSFPTRLFGQVGFHDPLEIYAFKEEGEVSKVPTAANIQRDQLLSTQRHDSTSVQFTRPRMCYTVCSYRFTHFLTRKLVSNFLNNIIIYTKKIL